MIQNVHNDKGVAEPEAYLRPTVTRPLIWTFVPTGPSQNRQFLPRGPAPPLIRPYMPIRQEGPAATLNPPYIPVRQESGNLADNILQCAGLLLPNGRIDYSKLDTGFNIKPTSDRGPHGGLADSQVIVLSDSSDEDNDMSRNKPGSQSINMAPRSGNVRHAQNTTPLGASGARNVLTEPFAGSQKPFNSTPLQRSSLQNTVSTRNSPFAVIIPPAKSQRDLPPSSYSRREHADSDLVDEPASTTSIRANPAVLGHFRVEIRSSPAPAVSAGYSITSNGKKRGRPFATVEAAAKAVAKLERIAARQASASKHTFFPPRAGSAPQAEPYRHSSANTANPSGSMTVNGKKRGRPFQTPEAAMAAAEARAAKMARLDNSDSADPKKRGRPFAVNKVITPPDGIYKPFICEWKDCPAELHNLDTLRQHLHIVHGVRDKTTHNIPCRWAKCGGQVRHKSEVGSKGFHEDKNGEDLDVQMSGPALATQTPFIEFSRRAEWQKHIEQNHLIPFSWHMGDGPSVGSFSPPSKKDLSETDPWLFNASGKQVTPSVHNQRLEAGRASFNNSRRFANQVRHDLNLAAAMYSGDKSSSSLNAGQSSFKRTGFNVVLPVVQAPEDFVVVYDSDSEDELAAAGELGDGSDHLAGGEGIVDEVEFVL